MQALFLCLRFGVGAWRTFISRGAEISMDLVTYEKAKLEWELALKLLPSDKMTRKNLRDFIYNKS